MLIDMISVPGDPTRPNEDVAVATLSCGGDAGVAVLLDGVTSPAGETTGCAHGVPWFTEHLAERMVHIASTRRTSELEKCLAAAISMTASAHGSDCDLSNLYTPQATIVAFRWDAERFEYLLLSDSILLLEASDATVEPVTDTRLEYVLAKPELSELYTAVNALSDDPVAQDLAICALRQEVDRFRNSGDGFFTVAADPGVGSYALTGQRHRSEVRSAAALSDGATRWTELFGRGGWSDLVELLQTQGAHTLVGQVRATEEADGNCLKYPRAKRHDDASVIYLRLQR